MCRKFGISILKRETEIYKVFDNMGDSHISNFNVVDDQGKRYQNIGEWDVDLDKEDKDGKCGMIQDGDRYELCFGIGEYGRRTYTFEYDIANFVQQYQDTQGFNYAFFSEMELEPHMSRLPFHLHMISTKTMQKSGPLDIRVLSILIMVMLLWKHKVLYLKVLRCNY